MIGLKRIQAVDADSLQDVIGPWSAGAEPLNEQLAAAIDRAIVRGDLAPGTRLPSERDLAAGLGLSRTTIVLAYDRLRSTGRIASRQGSGTRVAHRSPLAMSGGGIAEPYVAEVIAARAAALSSRPARAMPADTDRIELTIGALRGPRGPRLLEACRAAVVEDLPAVIEDFGYQPTGLAALREAVADLFAEQGVPTDPDQVVITTGAQQAVDLVARELVGPDGGAVIENPTYIGTIDALRAVGARMIPVAIDGSGLRTDVARAAVLSGGPRIVYTVPTFHNPTGAVMPEERRRELAELAAASGTVIVEDLTPDMQLGRGVPRPIAAFDRAERVVSLGSMSKAGWGGLRIGWMRVPHLLLPGIVAHKVVADHGTSLVSQVIARRLLLDREALARESMAAAAERRAVATEELTRLLPEWTFQQPAGGLSLWVQLPGVDAARFVRIAAEHGVLVRPGSMFSPDGGYRDHLRIAVGDEPDRLREGVARLARAWAVDRGSVRRDPQDLALSV